MKTKILDQIRGSEQGMLQLLEELVNIDRLLCFFSCFLLIKNHIFRKFINEFQNKKQYEI